MDAKIITRFWSKVDHNGPVPFHVPYLGQCWVWIASANQKSGYGMFYLNPAERMALAHRISWEINIGTIPKGMWVLHRCDNRLCVNPKHLFLGTHDDNMEDMVSKGRQHGEWRNGFRGINNGRSILSDDDIRAIRAAYRPGKSSKQYGTSATSLNGLAQVYGVSKKLILNIIKRRAWAHIA